jgi:hypothetical protein
VSQEPEQQSVPEVQYAPLEPQLDPYVQYPLLHEYPEQQSELE